MIKFIVKTAARSRIKNERFTGVSKARIYPARFHACINLRTKHSCARNWNNNTGVHEWHCRTGLDQTGPDHTPPKTGAHWTDLAQTGPDPASQKGPNGGDPSGGPKRAEVDQFTIRTLIRTKR